MGFLGKLKLGLQKAKNGFLVVIESEELKQKLDFVLFNLPKPLIKGMEIYEDVYKIDAHPNCIILNQSMDPIDIKRQIGKFVFRHKRWTKLEETTTKLLAMELIDIQKYYEVYQTDNYLMVYENVNADVFAVYYGNRTLDIDEISIAINSLYTKNTGKRAHSKALEKFIENLFKDL